MVPGWDVFRKDEKKKKEWEIGGMGVRGAWLGEEGKEENGGSDYFHLELTKI